MKQASIPMHAAGLRMAQKGYTWVAKLLAPTRVIDFRRECFLLSSASTPWDALVRHECISSQELCAYEWFGHPCRIIMINQDDASGGSYVFFLREEGYLKFCETYRKEAIHVN